jgi:undecaprenyl-diphosphatase
MTRRWGRYQAALRRLELRVLVACAIVVACTWAFVELADEALEGPHAVDTFVFGLLHDRDAPGRLPGPAWLPDVVRDYTALGSFSVVIPVIFVVAIGLFAAGHRRLPLLVLGACLGGLVLSGALKLLVSRDRPDVQFHAVATHTSSFPSGHAMNAAVVYATLGALVAQGQRRRRAAIVALATGAGIAFLVGASRVYLGVHWPTDVLAGLAAGFGWATLSWLVADRVRHHRSSRGQAPVISAS